MNPCEGITINGVYKDAVFDICIFAVTNDILKVTEEGTGNFFFNTALNSTKLSLFEK
ncbi:hypothetical protein [Gramella sp. AN32]|uniref:Uncharacterized protein n=1 Tax=Christiangramia antarctica TaxID=2058158 RepID=A0ABW5X0V2_9FLAO|nr:hypothetical protein [Gramella sp. AN32]